MDDHVLPSKLLSNLSLATDIVRGHDFVHLYSHFDTDGLTSAAIVAKALIREGKEFDITIFEVLNDEQMQVIENTGGECIIVTDLGASYIKRFDAMSGDIVVLDHHTVYDLAERICYANPHLYGIDGMSSGCGATMAFLFAITLNEKNWDLAPLAITGMAGDRQFQQGVSGLNTYVVNGAIEKGLVKSMPGSLIPVGNISSELFISTEPFIRGISGNADGTAKFLEEAGIPINKDYYDLSEEEALKLSSMICLKLIEQGVARNKIEECARTRYYLPTWGTDAETLSSVINACGREKKPSVGIAAALGDPSALEEAKSIDLEARRKIMEATLKIVDENKVKELTNIQWFDSSDSGFTGIVCNILMSYIGNPDKPTIGVNCADAQAKASSRGTFPLLDKGVNLAEAMKNGCAAVGGEGGGHRIAAGGSFDSSKLEDFLKTVDMIVGMQKQNAGSS